MDIAKRIDSDLVHAIKNKDSGRVGFLRMIKAAIKNKEIDRRAPLSDEDVTQVLKGQLKQRVEAMEQFDKGGRQDLVAKEQREKRWLESYLPEAISKEEVEALVREVIAEIGARGPKEVGPVMKESMARLKATGKTVDGKLVNSLARAQLERLEQPSD